MCPLTDTGEIGQQGKIVHRCTRTEKPSETPNKSGSNEVSVSEQ